MNMYDHEFYKQQLVATKDAAEKALFVKINEVIEFCRLSDDDIGDAGSLTVVDLAVELVTLKTALDNIYSCMKIAAETNSAV